MIFKSAGFHFLKKRPNWWFTDENVIRMAYECFRVTWGYLLLSVLFLFLQLARQKVENYSFSYHLLTTKIYRICTAYSLSDWYTAKYAFWSGTSWYTKLTKVNKRLTNTWNWAAFSRLFFISLSYFVYHLFSSLRILLLICWKMNLRSLQRRRPVERQSSNMIHLIHYDISWYMVTEFSR